MLRQTYDEREALLAPLGPALGDGRLRAFAVHAEDRHLIASSSFS